MPRNFKFHAIALSAICTLVVLMYLITKPASDSTVEADSVGDHFIRIDSATWGEACNAQIQKDLRERQFQPAQRNAKGDIVAAKPLEIVTQNNVLPKISANCDGKQRCEVLATSTALDLEPYSSCYKHLKGAYRCFTFDGLHFFDVSQGSALKINCDDTSNAATK